MRDNWELIELQELCDVRDGTHDSPKYHEVGVPFVTSKNLTERGISFEDITYISFKDHKKFSERSLVENGDILFGMIGTVGKPVIVNVDFEFSIKNVALLKFSKSKKLLNSFALYVLKSFLIEDQFRRKSDGGVQSFVSLGTIRKLCFPVPPLPQQRKIAKILSTCDTVIAKTEEAIAKYQAIKQGMMHDLFTRGIDLSTGKLRPKYQDAPELYKESELGMIPKDWEVKRLEDIAAINMGQSPDSSAYNTNQLGLPLVQGNADIKAGYTSPQLYTQHITKIAKKGEIIMTVRAPVGDLAISINDCCIGRGVCSISTESKMFLINYLRFHKSKWARIEQGTTFAAISRNDIISHLIVSPQKEEKSEISNSIDTISKKIQLETESLFKYHKVKSGLMQDLLSGKVEVSVSKEEEIMNA